MTRQSLRLNAAFAALDAIDRKINIEEITDILIDVGYIGDSPDDYRRLQVNEARQTVREHRKSKARSDEIQHELVNLFEVDDQGKKQFYFRPCGSLNPKEAAQHLTYWNSKIEEDKAQFKRYYRFHKQQHGRKLQRLLDFHVSVEV